MEKGKLCARQLKDLADELESLREKFNIVETVSNTAAAIGSLAMVVAGVATVLTAGAAAPTLGLAAGVTSLAGAGVTVASKITEYFCTCNELKSVKQINKDCRRIAEEMKEHFEELKLQSGSRNSDEQLKYIMREFLKAFAKHRGLRDYLDCLDHMDELMNDLIQNPHKVFLSQSAFLTLRSILAILESFALKIEGRLLSGLLLAGEELAVDVAVARSRALLKGGLRVIGGVVCSVISIADAIKNWTDLIKDNNETKASKEIREKANSIQESVTKISKMMDMTETSFTEVIQTQRRGKYNSTGQYCYYYTQQ